MGNVLTETDFKADPERSGTQQLAAVERRHHILGLRRRGMSYQQISDTLCNREALSQAGLDWEPIQVSAQSCSQIVKRYLHALESEMMETRDELRLLENERLDELLRTWLPRTKDKGADGARAAAIVLRLMQRRSKLNGLDAPTRVDVNHTGSILHELGVDPEELERQRQSFVTAFGGELPETVDAEYEDVTDAGPEDS